jgi:four helix bundle protein
LGREDASTKLKRGAVGFAADRLELYPADSGNWNCLHRLKGSKCIEVMIVGLCRAPSCGMSDFKKLLVWQKAHALALHAHRTAMGIRASRYASLRSQIIRSAMSIPANIVEGRRQASERDFARFLNYSLNSAYELEYHLMLAREMEVIADAEAGSLLAELIEVRRMLHGLLKRIKLGKAKPELSSTRSRA